MHLRGEKGVAMSEWGWGLCTHKAQIHHLWQPSDADLQGPQARLWGFLSTGQVPSAWGPRTGVLGHLTPASGQSRDVEGEGAEFETRTVFGDHPCS